MTANQQQKFMLDLQTNLKRLKKSQDIWPLTVEEEKALDVVVKLINGCL